MGGGPLKDIPAGNKGLPNLPTEVRNKMGFKKDGGMMRAGYKKGKSVKKGYHKTKDGRTVKKGLYYYMNRAKKRGTSKSKKNTTVTEAALKRSAKTAKA
tara:strand:+ start:58 stop:354 length:297 start_codon:yes stop_codon:yes gene_type:complete